MKLYIALNEAGTHSDIGLHAKICVLSAIQNTSLEPILLYSGSLNAYTTWLKEVGVQVINHRLPYQDTIEYLAGTGQYTTAMLGHWLRTSICLIEKTAEFVLYTDVDVLFRSAEGLSSIAPRYFAAAPEFRKDVWNYFNSGVMVINVARLNETYIDFEDFIRSSIFRENNAFHDQIAYNRFYRNQWDRLSVYMNWKPYWGLEAEAKIIHFHGPKIGAMEAICNGQWDWSTNHGSQVASIFASHVASYGHHLGLIPKLARDLPAIDTDRILRLTDRVTNYDHILSGRIDTSFMDFRMFGD